MPILHQKPGSESDPELDRKTAKKLRAGTGKKCENVQPHYLFYKNAVRTTISVVYKIAAKSGANPKNWLRLTRDTMCSAPAQQHWILDKLILESPATQPNVSVYTVIKAFGGLVI